MLSLSCRVVGHARARVGAHKDRSDDDNDIGVARGQQRRCCRCRVVGHARMSVRVRACEDGSDDNDNVVA